jgi:hypothetical protein
MLYFIKLYFNLDLVQAALAADVDALWAGKPAGAALEYRYPPLLLLLLPLC